MADDARWKEEREEHFTASVLPRRDAGQDVEAWQRLPGQAPTTAAQAPPRPSSSIYAN